MDRRMTQQQDSFIDQSKEKFRPTVDADLDSQVDAALAGVSIDQILDAAAPSAGAEGRGRISGVQTGVVHSINIQAGEVLVELDGKNQGVAPLTQFDEEPRIGDVMEFFVERFDERESIYKLLKKGAAAAHAEWDTLHAGQILEGTITAMNKGGLEMQIGTLRAFMPAGQVDIQFHKDISVFLGQKAKVAVQKVDRKARNLIVSRRQVIEGERKELQAKLFEELAEGQTRRGTVRSVMDYGAFVDLGGADGLVHISELTHRRGVRAADVVKVGDLVDVKVTKFDRESGKISLSLKQLMADPWQGAEMKYSVGTPVTGRVSKIEKFGAFVEVEEGLEGLLPVSEISWQRVNRVDEVLKVDDIVKLAVIAIDPVAKKLTFSLKQAGPDPWKSAAERYNRGDVVTGTIQRVVDFGAFVELEPGLEGLVHISELSDRRVKTPGEVAKAGQQTEVRILEVDAEKRRISLSIKQVKAPAPLPEPVATTPATPAKPRKKKELRGGLESGWFK
jgi:small subunit ribosomal protein S1